MSVFEQRGHDGVRLGRLHPAHCCADLTLRRGGLVSDATRASRNLPAMPSRASRVAAGWVSMMLNAACAPIEVTGMVRDLRHLSSRRLALAAHPLEHNARFGRRRLHSHNTIRATTVLATGGWSGKFADLPGVTTPVVPKRSLSSTCVMAGSSQTAVACRSVVTSERASWDS
jgi:hypothetical protein